MTDNDAIAEFERWFAHMEAQKSRAEDMLRLARLSKTEPVAAREQLRRLNKTPLAYDGARLYPAVRHAYYRLKALGEREDIES